MSVRRVRRVLRRTGRRLRPFRPAIVVLAVLAVAGSLWVGSRLFLARRDLVSARADIARVENALRDGDAATARRFLGAADRAADRATSRMSGVVVRRAEIAPVVGRDLRVVRGLAAAASTLTSDVLPGLADAAAAVTLRGTRVGTQIDLAPFRVAEPPLARSVAALGAVRAGFDALPDARLQPVVDAQRELARRLDDLHSLVTGAHAGARLAPPMLGGSGTRRYFVAIQNNAESRAGGGLIGSYAIVEATSGRLRVVQTGANDSLRSSAVPVVPLPADQQRRYADVGLARHWHSANLTPDFPTTGRILAALWARTGGQPLDGVIAVDPLALRDLLQVIGPVRLVDGVQLTAANTADQLLRDVYRRFPRARDADREAYLSDTTRRIFDAATTRRVDAQRLAERLGHAVATGHLKVYAVDGSEQSVIAGTPLAGRLPGGATPYLQVVTQDVGGSKLDYYLRRAVSYRSTRTGQRVDLGLGELLPEERADVSVELTNTAPKSGLPEYVTLRPDLPGDRPSRPGQSRLYVSVYAAQGATLESATLDGKPVSLASQTELGHAVFSTLVTLDPGQRLTLRLRLFQPSPAGSELRWVQQPLVVADQLLVDRAG